jgi:carbonic anhydrase
MRLFEAILEANHRAAGGDKSAGLHVEEFADSLPLIALTCIDPRLNPLMPEVLGIPEEKFIWLRNAANIITSSTSSTMRSLALACAVKGGKEIAIIGHTDCKIAHLSALDLTDRFKAQGIDRSRLPENLVEFFGMFASERQNVMRGVDFIRQSPLIGSKTPVHGLVVDINTGKLEWVVNGYQTLAQAASVPLTAPKIGVDNEIMRSISNFNIGDVRMPDMKIGDSASKTNPVSSPIPTPTPITPVPAASAPTSGTSPLTMKMEAIGTSASTQGATLKTDQKAQQRNPQQYQQKSQTPSRIRIDKTSMYKVLGDDRKVYGPVTAAEIERWVEEGRIDLKTLAQKIGYHEWKQLETYMDKQIPPSIPIPPALTSAIKTFKEIRDKMGR